MSFTELELDHTYCQWSGRLHKWVKEYLGASINCQYLPREQGWRMKIWPGEVGLVFGSSGVFRIDDTPGTVVIALPKPEDDPSEDDLDKAFRKLCLSAAWCLGIEPRQLKLWAGTDPKSRRRLPR